MFSKVDLHPFIRRLSPGRGRGGDQRPADRMVRHASAGRPPQRRRVGRFPAGSASEPDGEEPQMVHDPVTELARPCLHGRRR